MNTTVDVTPIPTPGTPAYWTAQREAVALLHEHSVAASDVCWVRVELEMLRRIEAHGFAARMFAAQGNDLPRMLREVEQAVHEIEEDEDAAREEETYNPDAPPHGDDWCRRGCQILYGMKCGMCGYDGPGVSIDKVDTVAEYCCHCNARTYQSPEGICTLCGKEAETPDAPAPHPALCFQNCSGAVTTDSQCDLRRDLERQARSIAAAARQEGQAAPGLATAALLARAALACSRHPLTVNPCTHHP